MNDSSKIVYNNIDSIVTLPNRYWNDTSIAEYKKDDGTDVIDTVYKMCTMEEVVDKFINWNPVIMNYWKDGYCLNSDVSISCPTYTQIKNSASLKITLYKNAIITGYKWQYKNDSLICGDWKVLFFFITDFINSLTHEEQKNIVFIELARIDLTDTLENIARNLTAIYPPSNFGLKTGGEKTFTVSGKIVLTYHYYDTIRTYESTNYTGILDDPTHKKVTDCPIAATFKVVPIYNYTDGVTYKFNGDINQFPKLKIVGQYEEDAAMEDNFIKQYKTNSKSLLRLRDILGIYKSKKITIRLNNFSLTTSEMNVTSNNCVFSSFYSAANQNIYTYNTVLYDSFYDSSVSVQKEVIKTVNSITFNIQKAEVKDYDNYDSFTYTVSDSSVKDKAFSCNGENYTVSNISDDITIDINGILSKRKYIYVSCEDPVTVVCSEQVVVEEGGTNGFYLTAYNESKNDLNFQIYSSHISEYSGYRYLITYQNEKGTYYVPNTYDPEEGNSTLEYKVWKQGMTYNGVTCNTAALPSINMSKYDSASIWIDLKTTYKPHKVYFYLYDDISLLSVYDNSNKKWNQILLYSSNGIRKATVNDIGEGFNSLSFKCGYTINDPNNTIKGWYYKINNSMSQVFQNNAETTINIFSDETIVAVYLSRIDTATWKLITDSNTVVFNNFTNQTLISGQTYETTPDSNNRTLSLNISALAKSKNNIATLRWSCKYNGVAQESFGYTKDVDLGNDGYTFSQSRLNVDDNYLYELDVSTYKKYITKTVNVIIENTTYIECEPDISSIVWADGTNKISYGSNGIDYIYTMTSGTIIKFKFTINKDFIDIFPKLSGSICCYVNSTSVRNWINLSSISFDTKNDNNDYTCTLEYDCSKLTNFDNCAYVTIDLTAVKTVTYTCFVQGDGRVQLALFKKLDNADDVLLFPKDTSVHQFVTSYSDPSTYKMKIMCSEDSIYPNYSYLFRDNADFTNITSGYAKFDTYTDSSNNHYNYFQPPAGALEKYTGGTILTVTALYDNILYWRQTSKFFMISWRNGVSKKYKILFRR